MNLTGSSLTSAANARVQRCCKCAKWKAQDSSLAESARPAAPSRKKNYTTWLGNKTSDHPSSTARLLYRNFIELEDGSFADRTEKTEDREAIQRSETDGDLDKQSVRILKSHDMMKYTEVNHMNNC